jgi:hypothetical protein
MYKIYSTSYLQFGSQLCNSQKNASHIYLTLPVHFPSFFSRKKGFRTIIVCLECSYNIRDDDSRILLLQCILQSYL